jgi:hypothetical protein
MHDLSIKEEEINISQCAVGLIIPALGPARSVLKNEKLSVHKFI